MKNLLLGWLVMGAFFAPFAVGWVIAGDAGIWFVGMGYMFGMVFILLSVVLALAIAEIRR